MLLIKIGLAVLTGCVLGSVLTDVVNFVENKANK